MERIYHQNEFHQLTFAYADIITRPTKCTSLLSKTGLQSFQVHGHNKVRVYVI